MPEGFCWLCERPLGRNVEWHHIIPKSRGGRIVEPLHPICHSTLHVTFTNVELAAMKGDRDALTRSSDMTRFLRWIARKPADFHAPTRRAG